MNDVLIVTSRNVTTAGGELSLIKNRAAELENNWGFTSEIISLCNKNLNVSPGDEAFGNGVYIRKNFSNPLTLLQGYEATIRRAEGALRKHRYKAVLLSGVGMLRYVNRIKKAAPQGTLVCADVHGYYGDGRLLSKDEPFFLSTFHKLAAFVEEYEQKHYLHEFDRIFVVSNAYKSFLCETANCTADQFYVVPCGLGTWSSPSTEESIDFRRKYRSKYGASEDELLMLYSGGVSAWQCLPQTIKLFEEINNRTPAKLLILSGDKAGALSLAAGIKDVIVDSYPPSKLPEVFCAADFCFMLRDNYPTNHFAYPNKFLEYAAAHKPVILTPYIFDISRQIEEYGTGIVFDGNVDHLLDKMRSFSCPDEAYIKLIEHNSFKTTLEPFADDLSKMSIEEL